MVKHLRLPTIFTALVVATHSLAAETKGAGSTFVSPVMTKWIDAYKAKTGNDVSYQPVGSSVGVGLIKKAAVDFGASDMPLDPKELEKLGMMQFPIVIGGVVPVSISRASNRDRSTSQGRCLQTYTLASLNRGTIRPFKR